MLKQQLITTVLVFVVSVTGVSAQTTVFEDTFSDGAPGTPVSINDPEPQGDPNFTVQDNASLSGTILCTFGPDQRAWAGRNADGGTLGGEAGGEISWQPSTAVGRAVIAPDFDFNNASEIVSAGAFTISLDDVDPVDTGNGTSLNWVAISLFAPQIAPGGSFVSFVNTSYAGVLPLSMFIRDNGELSVRTAGNTVLHTVQLSVPGDFNYDIDVVITNISAFDPNGNSFDYDIVIDGVSQASGTITGADTSNNFISLETTSDSATISGFAVATPTTVLPGSAWDGDASNLWNLAANWAGDTLPGFTGFADTLTFAAPATGGGALTNDVLGVQVEDIVYTFDAPTFTLSGNAVELSSGITNGSTNTQTITLDVTGAGALNLNALCGELDISGRVSGTSGLIKGGGSPLTLSNGANDISGEVSFTGAGGIVLAASGALGDPNSSVIVGPASIEFSGGVTQAKNYVLASRGDTALSHLLATNGVNTINGTIVGVSGGNRYNLNATAGAQFDVNADIDMTEESSGQRQVTATGAGTVRLFGQINDAPGGTALGVRKSDGVAGLATIEGAKNYSGDTTAESGEIALIDGSSTNNVPNSVRLEALSPDGELDFSGLQGGGIELAVGQTLGGDGTFIGSVLAGAGAVIDPAGATGSMTLSSLTLSGNSRLDIEIDGAGNDIVDVTGSLTGPASGFVDVNVSATATAVGGTYTILDWTGAAAIDVDLADFKASTGNLAIVGSQLRLTIMNETRAEVLVSDTGNNRVLKYDITQFGQLVPDAVQPVFAEGVIDGFQLLSPTGLAQDSAGNVYIAEGLSNDFARILKLDSAGNFVSLVGEVGSFNSLLDFSGTPGHMTVGPDDQFLYVSIATPNSVATDATLEDVIYRLDLSGSTAPVVYIDPTDPNDPNIGLLTNPRGLAFGSDGKLYVSNNQSGGFVERYDVSGASGLFSGALSGNINVVRGLFFDVFLGRMMVSLNFATSDIFAYTDLTANDVGAFEESQERILTQTGFPIEIEELVFVAGEVFGTDSDNESVVRVTSLTTVEDALDPNAAGLLDPFGLLVVSEIDPFDFDNDADVDIADVDVFLPAVNGPEVTAPPLGTTFNEFQRGDIDNDGDVDQRDVWAFMRRYTN